jgi:hypothetical protein
MESGMRLTMGTFSPEFAALWLTDSDAAQESPPRTSENPQGLSPLQQQQALEELVERVTAARSVL